MKELLANITQGGDLIGWFVATIGTLGGVIGFLGRWIMTKLGKDIEELKEQVDSLEEKVDKEKEKREESDKRAFQFQVKALLPCELQECPKRTATSFSIGEGA